MEKVDTRELVDKVYSSIRNNLGGDWLESVQEALYESILTPVPEKYNEPEKHLVFQNPAQEKSLKPN